MYGLHVTIIYERLQLTHRRHVYKCSLFHTGV